MVASLVLAALALRAGLVLRRRRQARERRGRALLARHMRLARPAVAMIVAGFLGGALSAFALRGWTPLGTFHAWLGLLAAALFSAAAVIGHRLAGGRSRAVDLHGWLGLGAVLVSALASVAGFVLLP